MKRRRYKNGFQENDRTTHVKMYKSGKQWVQSLMSSIGLVRFTSKEELNVKNAENRIDGKRLKLLGKAALVGGAIFGGGGNPIQPNGIG